MSWTEISRAHDELDCARHASDMTDAEWAPIEPSMPAVNWIGRPRE